MRSRFLALAVFLALGTLSISADQVFAGGSHYKSINGIAGAGSFAACSMIDKGDKSDKGGGDKNCDHSGGPDKGGSKGACDRPESKGKPS